jgi:hypothetical protein
MAMKWTAFIVGIILIISPWVFGFSAISLAKWCNVLVGLVLAIMSAWMLFGPIAASPTPAMIDPPRNERPVKRKKKSNEQ